MVISAYLSAHGIEHGVYGFSLKGDLAGHVAVIAETEGARVLLDPTRATTGSGVRYFEAESDAALPTTAEILDRYAVLPARSYETPPIPGNPPVSSFIE
jgi:hypothetical protein